MKMRMLALLLALTFLTGCGKATKAPDDAPAETAAILENAPAPEPTPQEAPAQETDAPAQEGATTPDYGPDQWTGTYITADPSIEADPALLDSLTMTLPEGVTRHRVSDRQFDFVKYGSQVGGVMLVDIPRDMLEKAAESMDDFEVLADHLGKQVMSDIYPSEGYISGGGQGKSGTFYLSVMYETEERGGLWAGCWHRIYVGEEYCYDFWIDDAFWGDSGFGITDSLSGGDIKPELNQAEFSWSFADMPKTRRPFG